MIDAGPEGQGLQLATSCYRAADLIRASGMVPVGTSVGRPRWPLTYTLTFLRELAPYGLLEVKDKNEFVVRYRARLESIGVELLERRFRELSNGRDGCVLLCFEPAGAPCHRRVFASWWESETGQLVPELGEDKDAARGFQPPLEGWPPS